MYPAFHGVKLRPSEDDVQAFAVVEGWYVTGSSVFYPPRAPCRPGMAPMASSASEIPGRGTLGASASGANGAIERGCRV
jgi:hypothetical protein